MIVVSHLAKHLLYLKPEKDPARLALYHFLIHLCDSEQPLDEHTIERFVVRALSFEHWQNNRELLHAELETSLQSYQENHQIDLASRLRLWPRETQVFKIENLQNMKRIVEKSFEKNLKGYLKARVLIERNERVVAILVREDGGVDVKTFLPLAFIHDGELFPLTTDLGLHYDATLNFKAHSEQHLSIDSHSTARFRFSSEGCVGKIIRGYTFQKVAVLDGGKLNRYPALFYPVKRLEQLFINRKTDPMYIELVQILEKGVDLVRQNHPDAMTFAKAAHERGKLALEQIFPDDNLVRLLINTLEVVVRNEPHSKPPSTKVDQELWEDLL